MIHIEQEVIRSKSDHVGRTDTFCNRRDLLDTEVAIGLIAFGSNHFTWQGALYILFDFAHPVRMTNGTF